MACGGVARIAAILVLVAAGIAAPIVGRCASARDRERRDGSHISGDLVASCVIPRAMLAAPRGEEPAVLLGGIRVEIVEAWRRLRRGGGRIELPIERHLPMGVQDAAPK